MKSLSRKSRLSGLLSRPEREEFARLLLAGALKVLKEAGLLASSYVVSPDGAMLDLAARAGSRTVTEPEDMGVNSAVQTGIGEIGLGADVLVIPADLPLLKPSDLRHMMEVRSCGADVVLAPSHAFDGTNALLFNSSESFPLSYDDNSFWNHLAGAAGRGFSVAVCTDHGLTFDVDSPEDFRELARSASRGEPAGFARRTLG